ncbi:MAG: class I SAM-dependent methyltransferase [Bacteroidota bacterium]
MSLRDRIRKLFFKQKEKDPPAGYDLWAGSYDNQPDNLMLALDELVFSALLKETSLAGRTVLDIGCGTGRHWNKFQVQSPGRLVGYDVSGAMLDKLKIKFPGAEIFLGKGSFLPEMKDHSCHLIVSTLTIAHIENLKEAFTEWDRVLQPGGEIIFTDYHPKALARGGKRTFRHEGKQVAVKNYIHSIDTIRQLARQLHFRELRFMERMIDDAVKDYYVKQNALSLFEQYRGTPIIYGIHLKKADDPA